MDRKVVQDGVVATLSAGYFAGVWVLLTAIPVETLSLFWRAALVLCQLASFFGFSLASLVAVACFGVARKDET